MVYIGPFPESSLPAMKRLIISLLAAFLAGGLVLYILSRTTPSSTSVDTSRTSADPASGAEHAGNPSILGTPEHNQTAASPPDTADLAEEPAAPPPPNDIVSGSDIEEILLELHELAMQDDAASFERILGFLDHPSQEVRITAVVALEQYADPAAIPHLQAAATRSRDQEFQARVAESIDFLKLPALRDLLDDDGNLIPEPGDANPDAE